MIFTHQDRIGIWHYQHYRENFKEKWPENLCRQWGLNSRPCAPHRARATLLSCVDPAFSAPRYSCWVVGLLEAALQGRIHPNSTSPTARLRACCYHAWMNNLIKQGNQGPWRWLWIEKAQSLILTPCFFSQGPVILVLCQLTRKNNLILKVHLKLLL